MKYKYQALISGTVLFSLLLLFFSCKKINDATTLGTGLIPAVDNINTFETSLDVDVFNDTFSLLPPNADSLRLRGTSTFFLGEITNNPLFGTTRATLFTQLKPASFRFSYGYSNPDSLIGLDSVVLVLAYLNTYGDSLTPQSVNVYEIDPSAANDFRFDTSYLVRENHIAYTNLLGTATYTPQSLDDSIHLFKDSASHQLRIKLDNAFGQRLLAYDSSATSATNAYYSDSAFDLLFKGFAVVPAGGGNGVVGIDLTQSKLSVYYKYRHGILDTAVSNLVFSSTSASANFIQRNYTGSQLANNISETVPQDYAFIQTQPGSFAKIRIKGLDTLSNRIIHRAELYVTQALNDNFDNTFPAPAYLYLDAYDSVISSNIGIPYDVQIPDPSTNSIFSPNPVFGFGSKPYIDGASASQQWRFNISRYVQNIVKKTTPVYPLRLYAPFVASDYFRILGTDYFRSFLVNQSMVEGQVRVYGGQPLTNPQRMRVRIIYSKI